MCTAITIRTSQGNTCFGRTMDFLSTLELYISPRGYEWNNLAATTESEQYSFIGAAQDSSPVIFADGVNEMGLRQLSFIFGYTKYDDSGSGDIPEDPETSIAAIELRPAGALCVRKTGSLMLDTIRIVGQKDSIANTVAPLHWTDQDGASMVRAHGGWTAAHG